MTPVPVHSKRETHFYTELCCCFLATKVFLSRKRAEQTRTMCKNSQGEALLARAKVSMCFVKITVLLLYCIHERGVHYGFWIQLHICNKPYVYIIAH